MRGRVTPQTSMLTLRTPEQMVRKDHPLRGVKALADEALKELEPVFSAMYDEGGRESIPPERLLKSSLLIALFSVRSERLFCEQLDYNMLFRWFLDMALDEASFDHSTFSKNRDRLMRHEVAGKFFAAVVEQARRRRLLSNEHFSVDGTLLEAWASMKSFRPKDEKKPPEPPDDPGNPTVDFRGEKRSNETHESKTDPDARLARKGDGKEAKLCHAAHGVIENRHGLLVAVTLTAATGRAEVDAALEMIGSLGGEGQITLGADRGYDTRKLVETCRAGAITPHVAQKKHSAIDARTTRHEGYAISQRIRKRIEEVWGWLKTVAGLRKTRFRGREKVAHDLTLGSAAYNLLRIANIVRLAA